MTLDGVIFVSLCVSSTIPLTTGFSMKDCLLLSQQENPHTRSEQSAVKLASCRRQQWREYLWDCQAVKQKPPQNVASKREHRV